MTQTSEPESKAENRRQALAALSVGVVGIIAAQLLIPPLLPVIIEDFGITSTQAGVALSVMWVCAAIVMYPSGHWSDRLSRRIVLVGAVGMTALGLTFLSMATGYAVFLLSLATVGLGVGFYEPPMMATVSDVFKNNRGRAYGVISASYNLGSIGAAGLAAGILVIASWQMAFLPVVLLLLLTAFFLHHSLNGPYQVRHVPLHPYRTVKRIGATSKLRVLLFLFSLHMFIQQGSISFFPTLLQLKFGFHPTAANLAFATIYLIGLVFSPPIGFLGDRIGNRRVGLFGPVLGIGGLSLLLTVPTPLFVAVGTILFAFGLIIFWPVMTAEIMDELSEGSIGADYGAVRALFFGIGSLGPVWVGAIADFTSFITAYVTIIVGFVATGLLFGLLNTNRF